jgi:hypothetical protein
VLVIVLFGFAGPFLTSPQAQVAPATDEPVVQRFLSRSDERVTRYRALRRLEAHNKRFNKHGWIEAWTELTPDGRFRFEIVRQGGSDYIIEKVLRPLLEKEQKLLDDADPSRSAVTLENYELEGAETAGAGLVKLLVKPRREEVSLIDGAVFVTQQDADLVRVEGRLAKNPSFWTKRVDVVRRYDRIGGVRVPVSLDSVAQVRFAGTSTLTMTYEYEMVNGIPVAPVNAVASQP